MVEEGGRGLNRHFNLREAELSHWPRRWRDDSAETFNLTRTETQTAAFLKQITAGWSWTNTQYVRITHKSQYIHPSCSHHGNSGAHVRGDLWEELLRPETLNVSSSGKLPGDIISQCSPPLRHMSLALVSFLYLSIFPQFKGNAALSTCLGTNTMATIRRSKPNHLILVWIYYFLTFRQMKSSRILHQQLLFWSSHKCTGNSLQVSPCLAPRSLQAPLTVWISLITAQSHTLRIYKHPSQCGEENWRSYLGSHCEDY